MEERAHARLYTYRREVNTQSMCVCVCVCVGIFSNVILYLAVVFVVTACARVDVQGVDAEENVVKGTDGKPMWSSTTSEDCCRKR